MHSASANPLLPAPERRVNRRAGAIPRPRPAESDLVAVRVRAPPDPLWPLRKTSARPALREFRTCSETQTLSIGPTLKYLRRCRTDTRTRRREYYGGLATNATAAVPAK